MKAALFYIAFYICLFSQALFSGKQLGAYGDGTLFYYPHWNAPIRLWDPYLMTGFPDLADPQTMYWYPLALVLRLIPGSWNILMPLGSILASWFTYLFVRYVSRTELGGLMAGLIFGLCGFMSAHLGHVTVMQAALWIPAILLCLERLGDGIQWLWIALGGLAVGSFVLAGHPQIALYGLTLAATYAVARGFATGSKWRYWAASVLMIGCGIALSAIQTLPAMELAHYTTRATLSFADFSEHALPWSQLPTLIFPFLFGGVGPVFPGGIPYFGAGNITEVAGFVGLCGFALPAIALLSHRSRMVWFWSAWMAAALIASLGAATPLGRGLYNLPAFGQFRALGRFLLIFGFSAAVLAGYGVDAILEKRHSRRNAALALIGGACMITAAVMIGTIWAAPLRRAAAAAGARNFSPSVFANGWIALSLLAGCATSVVLALLIRRPASRVLRSALVLAVIAELAPFSWFGEWRFTSRPSADFTPPAILRRQANARWVPIHGDQSPLAEAPGDLPLLWQLPAVSKYGPLLPARYKELLHIETNGQFPGPWWDPANRALDITSGRFIAMQPAPPSQDLPLAIGNQCGATQASLDIPLAEPREISGIELVTYTGCSVEIAQGTTIAEMETGSAVFPIRVGIETAEWAAGCADVAPAMRHRAANVYGRHTVQRGNGTCQAQSYTTTLRLPKAATVSRLRFRWVASSPGILKFNQITLLDSRTGVPGPLSSEDIRFGDPARWKHLDSSGRVTLYENLRAQPRVWIVPQTLTARPDQIVRAIQTSRLPDGRPYDPAAVALIEEPLHFLNAADPYATVNLIRDTGSSIEIRVSSKLTAFLVLGDFYYPGWRLTVNGRPGRIYQTNYIQRGAIVPSGDSLVRFEFRPTRFYLGAAISLLTLISLIACAAIPKAQRGLPAPLRH